MRSWRQILGYRVEPDLPNGFGRDVKCTSSEYNNAIYVGVCVYQSENNTYAIWSEKIDPSWDDDIEDALGNARSIFEEHKDEYIQKIQEILQLPTGRQHIALAGLVNVDWLFTIKCEFLD